MQGRGIVVFDPHRIYSNRYFSQPVRRHEWYSVYREPTREVRVHVVGDEVVRVVHAGTVRIGRGVDIHANSCVDRGLFGETTIGDNTTIDDLVYVAHEVTIGRRCLIGAHAVINGSTVVSDDVWIGPGAVLSNGVTLGAGAQVTLGSVVTRDVPAGARVTGNFAIEHERFLAFMRSLRQ